MNSRGRRGSALGMPAGRLRGGFQASMLPGLSNGSGRCTGTVRPNVSGDGNSDGSQSSSPNTASRNLQSSGNHADFKCYKGKKKNVAISLKRLRSRDMA